MFDPKTDFDILREARDRRVELEEQLEKELEPHKAEINAIKARFTEDIELASCEEETLRREFSDWYRERCAERLEQQLAGDVPPPVPLPAGVSATAIRFASEVDKAKLPPELTAPDLKKINALVKSGGNATGVQVDVKYSVRMAGEK